MRPSVRRAAGVSLVTLSAAYAGLVALRIVYPIAHLPVIVREAETRRLDPALVCAVVFAESRFRADAESAKGAVGLMQVMPATGQAIADELGTTLGDLSDPATNIRFGTYYLRQMIDRFGDLPTALMAYNAGPTRVASWSASGEAPFPATTAYVRRVQAALAVYRAYVRWPFLTHITPPLLL